jgi:hypothetical protein
MDRRTLRRDSSGAGLSKATALLLLGLAAVLSPRPADAQVLTKVGSFVAPTGGGQPCPGNAICTETANVGFQPKAVIFFWTAQTATGFATSASAGYGFATSTAAADQRAVAFVSDDNLAANSGNGARWQWTDRCIAVPQNATVTLLANVNYAILSSITATGFSIQWQGPRDSAWIVHYMAVGGPDVTNASVGSFTPAAGTGSESVTGLGFQPNFLMFLSVDSNTAGARVTPDGKVSVGFAGFSRGYGITQGGSTAVSRAGTAPVLTSGAQLATAAILEKDNIIAGSSPSFTAAVTAFGSDGFTINKTVNDAGTETVVHYLALRGGQYHVGAITRPTAAGAQTLGYTGVGFTPKGMLFSSWSLVSQTFDEDARISFSAADATVPFQQRATFFHDKMDNPATNDNTWVRQGTSGTDVTNGKVVYLAQAGDCPPKFADPGTTAQCSAGPRVVSEADVASYDADGFTLNWTTNDTANANQIPGDEASAQVLYVAVGDTPPPPGLRTKVGSFFSEQFNGTTKSITGVGFRPRAIIFFWTSQQTPGFAANAQAGYGFATAAGSERAVNYLSDDNLPPGSNNTSRWQWTNRCIVFTNTSAAGTTSHEAQLVSMDSDGFTLTWPKATTVSYIVQYLALGGADLTDATTGTFRPSSGTGAQSVGGVGFQPDFLMFLSIDSNTTGARVSPDGKVSIGFAANGGSITQAALTAATRSATANAITSGAQAADAAIVEKLETTNGITFVGAVTSFDADGFTIDKVTNSAGTETDVQFLALRGGRYHVGSIIRPSTETPPSFPVSYTGVGFAPRGLLFMSWGHVGTALDPQGDAEARISFSAADSTPGAFNQRATFFHDKTDNPPNNDYMLVRQNTSGTVGLNGKAVFLAQAASCPPNPLYSDPAGTSQCSGITRSIAEADVASYDADGFTLDWTVNDTTDTNEWASGDERDAEIFTVAVGNTSTTEVELSSFTARGEDSAVSLDWETASELRNLGFDLYRSTSEGGPWEKITTSLIPGLGSSPIGARYTYADTGLANGVRYYYELEDVETDGRRQRHGPVSAVPGAVAGTGSGSDAGSGGGGGTDSAPGGEGGGGTDPAPGGGDAETGGTSRIAYGDPGSVSLKVVRRGARGVDLDLVTGGFYATREADGSVSLEIPGFEVASGPGTPAVPVRRAFVEAVAGRQVRIAGVEVRGQVSFPALRPALAAAPEPVVGRGGTVNAGSRPVRRGPITRGVYPGRLARMLGTAFQGEVKKALVELAPLQWQAGSGRLVLARRLRVRLVFVGRDALERPLGGSRGRLYRRPRRNRGDGSGTLLARLAAREKGLYALGFEQVFTARRRSLAASRLRLSRQGRDVPFHVAPDPSVFGPGSVLYFLSDGGASSAYANEAVYELSVGSTAGTTMPVVAAAPAGATLDDAVAHRTWEQNRYYLSGLLDAPDLWLWDSLLAGAPRKAYPLRLVGLAAAPEAATLSVWLQGASDLEGSPDHHVRAYVNGSLVAEASWDGKTAWRLEGPVPPGVLREGGNELELESVADTGVAASMVYLDRFSLDYPHTLAAEGGRFEATFGLTGAATLGGLGAGSVVVDTTGGGASWVVGASASADSLALEAEAGHSYLAVSPPALLQPEVRSPEPSDLRSTRNQADYLLLAPREFLPAATPLLDLRRWQGLRARAVAIEEVYDTFGHGERSPEAIRDFLAYAYPSWSPPSPRYVLLLGDATFDPKDYQGSGVKDRVPALMSESTYMWTVSDQSYAAVNGDDELPDLAVGRLPASSLEQAQALVGKLVAFEEAAFDLSGPAVLVADDADAGGAFEADSDALAAGVLSSHPVEKIYLGSLGTDATRSAILEAFDRGASLVSYVGHGGTAVWASENILNSWDMDKLSPQAQQPLLFTMDCLNGYFLPPTFDSLAEALVKADGKGAIAAFAPSGLSLDGPAHVYERALLEQLVSGRHARLGDAILAAQSEYADTGAFPELLLLYNLLGDPAMRLR